MSCNLEAEKLKEELNGVGEAHKAEVEVLKGSLQEHVQLVHDLIADQEHVQKDTESIEGHLNMEIKRLNQRNTREADRFRKTLEEVKLDRMRSDLELRKVKTSLDIYTPKLDENFREIEALRRELLKKQDSVVVLQQRLCIQSEELHSAREESSALKKERNAAREAHKQEVGTLKMELRELAQRVEYLTIDRDRVREDRESIKGDLVEIEWLKKTHARETERFRMTLEEANLDRANARSELRNVRRSLDAYAPKLDESIREIEGLRHELSKSKHSAGKLQQYLDERSQMKSEVKRLEGGLNAAREAHKREVERLEKSLQEHVQRVGQPAHEMEVFYHELFQTKDSAAELQQRLDTQSEELHNAQGESSALNKELSAAREAHKQEVEMLKKDLREHAQWVEHLTHDMEILGDEHSKTKELATGNHQHLAVQYKELHSAREESSALKKELIVAHEAHKQEVGRLEKELWEHAKRVEHLTIDRNRVRKDMESIEGNLIAEIQQLKQRHARETEQLEMALKKVDLDRMRVDSEPRKVRTSLDAHAPKANERLYEMEALRHELSISRDSAAELEQRLDIQTKELYGAREQTSALKTLLEHRTSELKGVQSFLTTADTFSGAEVISTIERLNAEFLQTTAFMAESMVESLFHETTTQVSKTDEQLVASKRVSDAMGGVIVHFLDTRMHKDNPILIQIAFQAYMTNRLHWIACAWIIGGDEGHNRFIDEIYQSMHEKEAQAIAGRWRALTRAHVPSTLHDSQIALEVVDEIISGLSDILLAAGCNVRKLDIASTLSFRFTEKIVSLVSSAMRVNKIIGKGVTSGDLEVMAVPPGTAFDVTAMEDSYNDGRSAKVRERNIPKVLCTTDLGLRKRTRVGTTGEEQWDTTVLLKPKVALESVIDNLDE